MGDGQAPLAAGGDQCREGRPDRHVGGLHVGEQAVTGAGAAEPASDAAARELTTDLVAGPGGVMTDEVGVVTGALTLKSAYADGQVRLTVQYKDADEWYAVTGGSAELADPAGLAAVHAIAVGLLNRPEG
ncbi:MULTISPECIES: hypothetical protein [unclassified Micromonospora]|uniref:hypothetical protein n=1 Tax=unclassified Micromonospora TaxID=2617518 RepID=UPI0036410BFC